MILRYTSSSSSKKSDKIAKKDEKITIDLNSKNGRVKLKSPADYENLWCGNFKGSLPNQELNMGNLNIGNSDTVMRYILIILNSLSLSKQL